MARSPSTLNINQIQAEVAPDWQIDPKRLKAVEVVGEGGKILLLLIIIYISNILIPL